MRDNIKIFILTVNDDISASSLEKKSKLRGYDVEVLYYNELIKHATPIPKLNLNPDGYNYLIPRYPYFANNVNSSFVSLLKVILENYNFSGILDEEIMRNSNFLEYDDKLYQSSIFSKLKLPYPSLYSVNTLNDEHFPIIAKKRFASRGKGNFILKNSLELEVFIQNNVVYEYIFCKFLDVIEDYRVVILKNSLVGVMSRSIRHKGNRVLVKSDKLVDLPGHVINECIKLTTEIGCDLCGIDVVKTTNNEYFYIEYNLSCQFAGFSRVTGIDVASQIINSLVK